MCIRDRLRPVLVWARQLGSRPHLPQSPLATAPGSVRGGGRPELLLFPRATSSWSKDTRRGSLHDSSL
eukprot:15270838-Alexandrium_andersonii.AAC.1